MLTVTERAAEKALALATKDNKPQVLRVGVQGGGCAGFSYVMDFDATAREGDHVFEVAGLTVRVDAKSAKVLDATTLDYSSNLMSMGFRFENPLAKRTCGCGDSFAL